MANIHTLEEPAPAEPTPFATSASAAFTDHAVEPGEEALVMRGLRNEDLVKVEKHLLDLCRIDRATRFLGAPSDEVVSGYARQLDPSASTMVGAFGLSGRLLGFAEAQPTETKGRVEIAVTVAHDCRRRGLGRALVARVVELSFDEGAHTAEFNFCPSNKAIVRLILALGGRFGPSIGTASISHGSKIEQQTA